MSQLRQSTLLVLFACQAENISYYTGQWPVETPVTIWVQAHPDIDHSVIRDGCEAWKREGVVCIEALNPEDADIRYRYAQSEKCEALGTSFPAGEVEIYLDCIDGWPRPVDMEMLQAVAAHETGHQLGVPHVWTDCDTVDDQELDNFLLHCGRAIMNTRVRPMLTEETVADHEAFCFGSDIESVVPFADRLARWDRKNP